MIREFQRAGSTIILHFINFEMLKKFIEEYAAKKLDTETINGILQRSDYENPSLPIEESVLVKHFSALLEG